jgi:inorganic phosphate transporter, PiT family
LTKHPFGDGVNWGKLHDTFMALFLSPIIGFFLAGALLLLMKAIIRNKKLYEAPDGEKPPVWWIRGLLVLTCTGVSFAHGSNDGQKGMGLIMLILIGVLPGVYAINPAVTQATVTKLVSDSKAVQPILAAKAGGATIGEQDAETVLSDFLKSGAALGSTTLAALAYENNRIAQIVASAPTFNQLTDGQRKDLRTKVYLVGETIGKLTKSGKVFTDPAQVQVLTAYKKSLDGITKFIPIWVKFAVALCLGIGTMIGWRRIVVTIGEKIGKSHLTYGQGAAAEIVTWATIQGADFLGLPVSTTHILSSGVAGTMAANRSGLQTQTLRNIVLAWVLTVPVTVFLGATLFGAGFYVVLHFFAK